MLQIKGKIQGNNVETSTIKESWKNKISDNKYKNIDDKTLELMETLTHILLITQLYYLSHVIHERRTNL